MSERGDRRERSRSRLVECPCRRLDSSVSSSRSSSSSSSMSRSLVLGEEVVEVEDGEVEREDDAEEVEDVVLEVVVEDEVDV